MMSSSRRDLKINTIFGKALQRSFIHLVRDSECPGGRHCAVRQKGEGDAVFLNRLTDLRRLVRGDADELESELRELRCDVTQLNQLPVAMRSPAATIKDQDCRPCLDGRIQIKSCIVGCSQRQLWNAHPV